MWWNRFGVSLFLALATLDCGDREPAPQPTLQDAGDAAALGADAAVDAGIDAGSPESGVDPSIRLVDLSTEQAARVCSAWSARLDRAVPRSTYLQASCTQQAWPLSADAAFMPSPTRCQELLARCLANDGGLGGFASVQSIGADLIGPTRCVQPLADLDIGACEATVGELETCSVALSVAVAQHLMLITCEVLTDPEGLTRASQDVDFAMVPDCQGLQMHCPALMFYSRLDGRPPP